MEKVKLVKKLRNNLHQLILLSGKASAGKYDEHFFSGLTKLLSESGLDFLPKDKVDSFFKVLSISVDILAINNAIEQLIQERTSSIEDTIELISLNKLLNEDKIGNLFLNSEETHYKWLVLSDDSSIDDKFKQAFKDTIQDILIEENFKFQDLSNEKFLDKLFEIYKIKRKKLTEEFCKDNSENLNKLLIDYIKDTNVKFSCLFNLTQSIKNDTTKIPMGSSNKNNCIAKINKDKILFDSYKTFVGRDVELSKIDTFFKTDGGAYFVFEANAGLGKTALAIKIANLIEENYWGDNSIWSYSFYKKREK